jgi:CelD/BcsL family acetyltransferase involved in cellulose biosynthesis
MPPKRLSLDVANEIGPLAAEWDDLAERTGASPFVRPGWIRSWRTTFGRGELRILTVRREGRLSGLLPVETWRGGLRTPTNEHTPAFEVLAADGETLRALAEGLFAQGARAVTLQRLATDDAAFNALRRAAQTARSRAAVKPVARSPYICCKRTLEEHERSLSRNLRHDVERRLRRLCETGVVSVQVADGRDGLDELLDEAFAVERRGWKGTAGTAIASRPPTRRFYSEVASWAASRGWLRLAFLRLDSRAIAFQLDLELPPVYYSLKIGYDPGYERFSPGKLLAYAMVSRAVSMGLARYELLGTDEPWKYRWTQTFRDLVDLHAFSRSPAGFVTWSMFVHGRPLARRLPLASRLAAALRS